MYFVDSEHRNNFIGSFLTQFWGWADWFSRLWHCRTWLGKKDFVIISDTNKKGKLTSINFIKLPHTKKGKSYVAQTKALDGENGERFKDFIKNKIELSKNINLDSGHCNRFNQKVTCTFNLTN